MSNANLKSQIPEIRNLIEAKFGQFQIGQEGDRGRSTRYIGIHLDERDGRFKQWFSAFPQPLQFNNQCGGDRAYCRASLSTTFQGAADLLKNMSGMYPQFPPLELPSSAQFDFISKHIPTMLCLSSHIPSTSIETQHHQLSQRSGSSAKQIVALLDCARPNFLTRDDAPSDEIGFVLPVYSLQVPGLDHG